MRASTYLLLLLPCLLASTLAHSQLQKIYLNPKAVGNEKQSRFVDSIRFIPLEVNPEIEVTSYNNVQVTKNYFLIIDYTGNKIFLYTKDGRFLKKISYKKLGESFYPLYDSHKNQVIFFGNNKNYALTNKDRLKITLDWDNPRNKKYFKKYNIDLDDTSFTIKKDVPELKDIVRAFHFYEDHYYLGKILTSELYKDSLDHELKIYKNGTIVKEFFPYNHINETRFLYTEEYVAVNNTDKPTVNLVTRPFCDTVYKMINYDSLFPVYQVVLPLENSLPPSFFTKPFKNKTERENFNRNNGWLFHQVYNFYETPHLIYISVGYLSNYDFYIYHKKNNFTYKIKNIKPDSTQYNLNVLEGYGLTRFGDKFYKSKKTGDLITFFEKHKDVAIPKELESFLATKPPATATIIVEFKLKN